MDVEMNLEPGDRVQWRSNSLRRIAPTEFTDKRDGVFVGFIPSGAVPSALFPELRQRSKSRIKIGKGIDGKSVKDRCLIKIERFHTRTGARLAPDWYAPRVSSITAVLKEEGADEKNNS